MFPKSTFFLLFGVVLSLSPLSSCQNWETFQKKHISSSPDIDCNASMNQPFFYIKGHCKSLNTFILSSADNVKAICTGVPGRRDVSSTISFKLVNCIRISGTKPPCPYNASPLNNVICVRCESRLPVHFVKVGRC